MPITFAHDVPFASLGPAAVATGQGQKSRYETELMLKQQAEQQNNDMEAARQAQQAYQFEVNKEMQLAEQAARAAEAEAARQQQKEMLSLQHGYKVDDYDMEIADQFAKAETEFQQKGFEYSPQQQDSIKQLDMEMEGIRQDDKFDPAQKEYMLREKMRLRRKILPNQRKQPDPWKEGDLTDVRKIDEESGFMFIRQPDGTIKAEDIGQSLADRQARQQEAEMKAVQRAQEMQDKSAQRAQEQRDKAESARLKREQDAEQAVQKDLNTINSERTKLIIAQNRRAQQINSEMITEATGEKRPAHPAQDGKRLAEEEFKDQFSRLDEREQEIMNQRKSPQEKMEEDFAQFGAQPGEEPAPAPAPAAPQAPPQPAPEPAPQEQAAQQIQSAYQKGEWQNIPPAIFAQIAGEPKYTDKRAELLGAIVNLGKTTTNELWDQEFRKLPKTEQVIVSKYLLLNGYLGGPKHTPQPAPRKFTVKEWLIGGTAPKPLVEGGV